ncbi:MAG: glycosyltransferase [Candidatus Omnitrophica bacterium]|nr:glycosyltransferase [Candidatus Omnitrophota bacterium]
MHIEYPNIDPVPEGIHRPFWSVMIPTYNCALYLEQTLKSVLEQDPGPEEMQIEVVDDCSTKDDPEEVVKKIGKGRVSFYRQLQNVGPTKNFNTCIKRSIGQFVHILHGDDYVEFGFYEQFKRIINEYPEVALFACRAFEIDENNQINTISPRLRLIEQPSNKS